LAAYQGFNDVIDDLQGALGIICRLTALLAKIGNILPIRLMVAGMKRITQSSFNGVIDSILNHELTDLVGGVSDPPISTRPEHALSCSVCPT
jgi:hypothetical protein